MKPNLRNYIARSFYSSTIKEFIYSDEDAILGQLSKNSGAELDQVHAWVEQIRVLKSFLSDYNGRILFEFSIPRMGTRVDTILLIENVIFVIEFKVGEKEFNSYGYNQVWDYALDLKNFHEKSEIPLICPIYVATNAKSIDFSIIETINNDNSLKPIHANNDTLKDVIQSVLVYADGFPELDIENWEKGRYYPTPTIIEKASDLYYNNSVKDIADKSSDAENFTHTTNKVSEIINISREGNRKSICFITGVPGAGKTLVGLEIASKHLNKERRESSVYLSGNGPLVKVLQEALAMNFIQKSKEVVKKGEARSRVKAFIQNVHHFRDECLKDDKPQPEHVAIFDEAQRAWNITQTTTFMKNKKNVPDFNMSEPEYLISCMDRHNDWAVILCLVGGGQEINTGEAGIGEWIDAINRSYKNWDIYISENLKDEEYAAGNSLSLIENKDKLFIENSLHLAVSMRSYRAEKLSEFVKKVLDINIEEAKNLYNEFSDKYPLVITRDIHKAKEWLRGQARGSERYGMVVSSKAQRLKPLAIDVRYDTDPVHWFLKENDDVRSSYYLEDVATEFHIQGLELDWVCVTWDGDFRYSEKGWEHKNFVGKKWQNINSEAIKSFQKNAYRVLLTRARQGMIICIPKGDKNDNTRLPEFYDSTYNYFKEIGVREIE